MRSAKQQHTQHRVLIAGGGVAGVSMAHVLRRYAGDRVHTTLVERTGRIGGKSVTAPYGDKRVDIGTCFLSGSYVRHFRNMRDFGFELGEYRNAFVKGGRELGPLEMVNPWHAVKYLGLWLAHRAGVLREDASLTIEGFLERHGLQGMRHYLHVSHTAQGYGDLHTTSYIYLLRWITPMMLLTTARVLAPVATFEAYMQEMARRAALDATLTCDAVVGGEVLQRPEGPGLRLRTASGGEADYAQLVLAVPHAAALEVLSSIAGIDPADVAEFAELTARLRPVTFSVDLYDADNVGDTTHYLLDNLDHVRDMAVTVVRAPTLYKRSPGDRVPLAAYYFRREPRGPDAAVTGGVSSGSEEPCVTEQLAAQGYAGLRYVSGHDFSYFPRFSPEDVAAGAAQRLEDLRARLHARYGIMLTGNYMSFESIDNIYDYTELVVADVLRRVPRLPWWRRLQLNPLRTWEALTRFSIGSS